MTTPSSPAPRQTPRPRPPREEADSAVAGGPAVEAPLEPTAPAPAASPRDARPPRRVRGRNRWVRHALTHRRIYRGLAGGCARFPLPVLHAISAVGNTIAIACMKKTRRAVARNLRLALDLEPRAARRLGRRVFHQFGKMMIDLFRTRARGLEMVPPLGRHEHDDRVLSQLPKGCLLVTGHLGNWELGAVYLADHGFRIAEIGQPEPDPEVHALRNEIRSRFGIGWIEIGSSMATAFRVKAAVEQGIHVALLADRSYPEDRIEVDFLGRPTPFLRSPARLARFCRCPIVPCYLLRRSDGTYRSFFGRPLEVDPAAAPDAEDRRLMGEVARVLEQGIRADPSQWYNFYDYWADGSGRSSG